MTRDELLAEIIAMSAPPGPVGDDEVTVLSYSLAARCSRGAAFDRLERLVAQGALQKRHAMDAGRRCWAYRKANVGE